MKKLASLTLASILSSSGTLESHLEKENLYSSRTESNYFQSQEREDNFQMLAGQLYWSRLIIIKAVSPVAYC
tara:strand:- start:186 stop:401 length:216 start_codon:yes stop_codon:yes gene_type:complete